MGDWVEHGRAVAQKALKRYAASGELQSKDLAELQIVSGVGGSYAERHSLDNSWCAILLYVPASNLKDACLHAGKAAEGMEPYSSDFVNSVLATLRARFVVDPAFDIECVNELLKRISHHTVLSLELFDKESILSVDVMIFNAAVKKNWAVKKNSDVKKYKELDSDKFWEAVKVGDTFSILHVKWLLDQRIFPLAKTLKQVEFLLPLVAERVYSFKWRQDMDPAILPLILLQRTTNVSNLKEMIRAVLKRNDQELLRTFVLAYMTVERPKIDEVYIKAIRDRSTDNVLKDLLNRYIQ